MQEKRLSPSRFFRWQCMWMHVNLRRSQTAPTHHFMLKGCRHLFTGKLCLSFWISALSQMTNYKFRPPYRNMYWESLCYHMLYYYVTIFWLREAPFNKVPPLCGHCQNSNYTPPPHSNGHSGALFSGAILPFLPFFYHFLWISAPNHPGKGLDPPKIKQMPVWTWKILL